MAFTITGLDLKNGESLKLSPLTIIVGANNSGKTRLLKEIKAFIQHDEGQEYKIVGKIRSDVAELDSVLNNLRIERKLETSDHVGFTYKGGYFGNINQGVNPDFISTVETDLRKSGPLASIQFKACFGKACVALIRTEDRLSAAKQVSIHSDPEGATLLHSFYNAGVACEIKISNYIREVFGVNVKLDFTIPNRLSIRVGSDFSGLPQDPRDARPYMKDFGLLDDQGDGIRSFTTIVLMLHLTRIPCLLIDEPDAFLHPPQSADLGRIIAKISRERKHILIATHSVDFLRGLISEDSAVSIVRLTRSEKETTAHVLDSEYIKQIVSTPILNSSRVLESLFYHGVVILEGDSDRVFYEKIARQNFPSDRRSKKF